MSYFRVYPSKNNTLFIKTSGSQTQRSGNINTGKNTIFELMDGNGQSIIVMGFDLSPIKDLLNNNTFTCTLKMWDAGVIFEPILKDLKPINLYYFTEDFVEGDGFSFADSKAILGVSNWNKRDVNNDWDGIFTTGLIPAFQLQSQEQDIVINNLESFISNALTQDKNPNFAIKLETNTIDEQTYSKFIFSRHTRTIHKPYLEFFIDDVIANNRQNIYAGKQTKLYLLNQSGEDFTETPTCEIQNQDGDIVETPTVTKSKTGTYYITYTPANDLIGQNVFDIWSIDGVAVYKDIIPINSPNIFVEKDLSNIYFYPTTYYNRPLINKGDKIKFAVISESRSGGTYITNDYEYKIICSNGFEMQPWQSINIYNNKMFFVVDTGYFFEELEYEVILRLKLKDRIQTSPMTYKFRVIYDGPTHLDNVAASPYNNRDIYLSR